MNSFTNSREKLVEFLIENGISDKNVLSAFRKIPRHLFVPEVLKFSAYKNSALPIGFGQTISQPYTVAYMTQMLEVQQNHKVLEIGTGSGFQTAILAVLSERVFTIERIKELTIKARKVHEKLNLYNIVYRVGDGILGWKEFSPFDRIIVTAAINEIPQNLINQLNDKGIIIFPLKLKESQKIVKIFKDGNKLTETYLKDCNFVEIL